jgi:glycosylphosphatidylinositol transamidase (GPIT) subunit GPI8
VKRQAVKVAAVPQIEGLTVEDFLKHAKKKPMLMKYLPDEKDQVHLDKKWICDILYTVDTAAIQEMITKAISAR